MTHLVGPALLRAAADRLNEMDRAADSSDYATTILVEALMDLVQDLAAWLRAFSHEAEAYGWANPDGTWKLGSPTNYATAIARQVLGDKHGTGVS